MSRDNEDITDILENILYWETCPDEYKERIEKHLEKQRIAHRKEGE